MSQECQFVDEVEGEEEEEEAGLLTPEQIAQAVLYSTDWTTGTIISQLTQKNIDLSPRFQRRDAWTISRKSRFIESMILGLPVPEIVLAERKDARGRFLVLDGKQRLLTVLQFIGQATEGKNNKFQLSGLEVRNDLNGKSYSDFQGSSLINDLNAFNNSTIRSVVVRNWPNAALLHLIFVRLNTGSVSLSPQELRQALFPGGFVDFAYDRAERSEMLRKLLGIKEPDFRMRDVELLVRYEAFRFFLSEYAGNLRLFLDETCEKLNAQWEGRQREIQASADEFEEAIGALIKIFGEENIARKWTEKGYESRPNRAVLDIMTFYFSNRRIQTAAKKKRQAVVQAFKGLCERDIDFLRSIESTTKSMTATLTRLNLWGQTLSKALSMKFNIPSWDNRNKRIVFKSL